MDTAAVLIAVVTLAAGVAIGWMLAGSRAASSIAAGTETIAAAKTATATAVAERDAARAELAQVRDEREAAATARRTAETQLAEAATKLKTQDQIDQELKQAFAALSAEALRANQQQFLTMADDRFKLAGAPIAQSLEKFGHQLGEIERNRAGAQAALKQQIEFVRLTGEQLKNETASLVSALRKPQARGRWGELQLRACIDYAGMTNRCDFIEQETVSTADGALRPDLIVRLVGGKTVVVDSKVTLAAYLEAHDAADETVREERLAAHARHLRQHVDSLAAKAYWSQFSPSPEFVILFVPGEAFLAPALDRDPMLLEDALSKRVHIATPTTLISMLRTVGYVWQQQALAENAREVFDLGKEIYKRLGVMGDHMDKLGRSLTSAVKAYNGTVGSLEKNVLVTARKLNALEIVDVELESPNPVEEPVRPLGAPELVSAADEGRQIVVLPGAEDGLFAPDRREEYGIDARDARFDRRTGS